LAVCLAILASPEVNRRAAGSPSALTPLAQNADDGFVPMFNGKDLTGWVNVNCHPSTFFVKDGQIITTGRPTGYLRTDKQYENFIAEFDWMHIPNKPADVGNSGFFVWADPIPAMGTGYTRGIEVQVLVNLEWKDKKSGQSTATSQGDLFSIWGATCVPDRPHPLGWDRCIPSENRAKGEREWNHYRVEANNGVIKLAVNGKVVSGVSKCSPRKGYLALESEGSECRFKNLKIKELPSTNPTKAETCDVAQGHKTLYNGLDLADWTTVSDAKGRWQPRDTVLHYDGKGTALRTEKKFGDVEIIVDCRFPKGKDEACTFLLRDGQGVKVTITSAGKVSNLIGNQGPTLGTNLNPGAWNRLKFTVTRNALNVVVNGTAKLAQGNIELPAQGSFAIQPDGPMDFANLFVRELK
jgi:hypothetical protein